MNNAPEESSTDNNPVNNLVTITPVDNANTNTSGDTPLDESMINGSASSEGDNSVPNISGDTPLDESMINGNQTDSEEGFNPFAVSNNTGVQEIANTQEASSDVDQFIVPGLINAVSDESEESHEEEKPEEVENSGLPELNSLSESTNETESDKPSESKEEGSAKEQEFALPEMNGADLTLDDDDDDLDDKFDE